MRRTEKSAPEAQRERTRAEYERGVMAKGKNIKLKNRCVLDRGQVSTNRREWMMHERQIGKISCQCSACLDSARNAERIPFSRRDCDIDAVLGAFIGFALVSAAILLSR